MEEGTAHPPPSTLGPPSDPPKGKLGSLNTNMMLTSAAQGVPGAAQAPGWLPSSWLDAASQKAVLWFALFESDVVSGMVAKLLFPSFQRTNQQDQGPHTQDSTAILVKASADSLGRQQSKGSLCQGLLARRAHPGHGKGTQL